MSKQKETFKAIEQYLTKIETDIKRLKLLINQLSTWEYNDITNESEPKIQELASKLLNYDEEDWEIKVIEWVYDWYFMQWSDDKKYPVPMNYSSKTKLIPWDVLKLRILEDWKLIYKLISPAPRKFIKATLSKTDDNRFIAVSDDGKTYLLNQASVTFFKGNHWDELSIIVNSESVWDYAAIEAIIPQK